MLILSFTLALVAADPTGAPASANAPVTPAGAPAVPGAAAAAAPAPETPAAAAASPASVSGDRDPPIIEDVAVASSPDTAPVVTVTMSDLDSGVGDSAVMYRVTGSSEWVRAPLVGSDASALFLARLPNGVERLGFAYYIEASDKAGNGPARIGSADAPINAPAAQESTRERFERAQEVQQEAPLVIHPAFIMLSLGVGVLSGGGAGAFLIDLGISQRRLDDINSQLGDKPSDARRAELLKAQQGYENAVFYDTAIGAVLGVVAVAALGTGVALLIAANLE